MRDLQECRAEIFRRMEKGIQARKKRRTRAIACCASLCLLVLSAVTVRPFFAPGERTGDKGMAVPEGIGAPEAAYWSVEITSGKASPGSPVRETDSAKAKALHQLLSESLDGISPQKYCTSGGGEVASESHTSYKFNTDSAAAAHYTFAFSGPDGEKVIFRLNGNVLSADDPRRDIALSAADRAALLRAIRSIVALEVG